METTTTAATLLTTTKQQVQSLLQWDDLQYGQFQYDQGLLYLQHNMLGGDDTWLSELSRSPIFWQWWVNQWNIRDKQFLKDVWPVTGGHHNLMVDQYEGLHDHLNLDCKPHKAVMQKTYAAMMGKFIDQTIK